MNAGILPLVLLCAAFALAVHAAPYRQAWTASAVLAIAALIVERLAPAQIAVEPLFFALWGLTAILAAIAYRRNGLHGMAAITAALVAGACMGSVALRTGGGLRYVLLALPALLLCLPAGWLLRHGYGIAVKVVSSWLIAISVLAAMVALTPTPGYKPDHME